MTLTTSNKINPTIKTALDINKIRADFPILQQTIHGHPFVYFDNSSTTQKPKAVIDAITQYYLTNNANVHRGVHTLSQRATEDYENTRATIKKFINAKYEHEIIFTSGATASINLVADSFGRAFVKQDDEIIISAMEHHSNIVPWQLLCEKTGAKLIVIPITAQGELDLTLYEQALNKKTRLVAIAHASNVLGTINPLSTIITLAHAKNIPVLADGAQAAAHMSLDMQALDCDFYAFSAHKLYGPTGVGVLYGKTHWLEQMPPYQSGGNMISQVTFAKTSYQKLPYKLEAGTPNIANIIGFKAALDYVNQIGLANIAAYEQQLLQYATQALEQIADLTIIGTAKHKCAVISFVLNTIHAHDVGTILDHHGIAVRAGHHCAMPLMEYFNVPAAIRASFAVYNTAAEIDIFIAAILQAKKLFASS